MMFLTAAETTATTSPASLLTAQLLTFAIVLAFFYFLLIRPQQNQQKKRNNMLNNLKRGDKIITAGGLHGEIVAMREDVLTVRLADNVEVKMSRGGVSQLLS